MKITHYKKSKQAFILEEEIAIPVNPDALSLKAVEAHVKKRLKKDKLLSKLGLTDWKIGFDYGSCGNPAWAACCGQDPAYKLAHITIDPNHHENTDDLDESLIHELVHIVLSPVDAFVTIQMAGLNEESGEYHRLREHWRQANEQTVCAITKIIKPTLG